MKSVILIFLLIPQFIFCQRWSNISSLPGAYFKITFKSQLQGWALADNITIWHTSNGGYDWEKQAEYPDISFSKIYFSDTLTGWCVGEKGVILNTSDGGKTWNKTITNDKYKLKSIFFSGNNGWISGYVSYMKYFIEYLSYGIILKSTDHGNSWNRISDTTLKGLNDICFINEHEGWAAGFRNFSDVGENYMIHTLDGGMSWKEQNLPKVIGDLSYVALSGNKIGWSTGWNSPVLKTTDGGENWTGLSNECNFRSLVVFDSNEIWTSKGYKIYHSINGGIGWKIDTLFPITTDITDISFPDRKTGFAVSRDGKILKYTDKTVEVNYQNNLIANSILYNCYPNPANPTTKIDYYIQRESNVKIVIFDALGREIKTLTNDKRKPGLYSVFFDGSNYNSGIYFCRLISGDFGETKKLLLLK
jgi:photosystem II stability/assembly factor-like uncharacterized protein